jgi:hypothetical protein
MTFANRPVKLAAADTVQVDEKHFGFSKFLMKWMLGLSA